jgi:hypothetical protein
VVSSPETHQITLTGRCNQHCGRRGQQLAPAGCGADAYLTDQAIVGSRARESIGRPDAATLAAWMI